MIKHVGGDTGSVPLGQGLGNGGVFLGPIGANANNIVGDEPGVDAFGIQGGGFVGLAGDAPFGGEINKIRDLIVH